MESKLLLLTFMRHCIFNVFSSFKGKCAAASMDVLSGIFGDDFLVHLLPILKETLFSEHWEVIIFFAKK